VQEKTLELKRREVRREKKIATDAKPDIFLQHTLSKNEGKALRIETPL